MIKLDVNTPKGQLSLQQEQYALDVLQHKYTTKTVIQTTPKHLDAKCDGIIISTDTKCMDSVYEMKCRENLQVDQYGNVSYVSPRGDLCPADTWLITYEKIESCVDVAKKLRIPFIGLLYIVQSHVVYQFHISDANGNYMFPFETKTTNTQKTTNGGRIDRVNAYLPFKYAQPILYPIDFDTHRNQTNKA